MVSSRIVHEGQGHGPRGSTARGRWLLLTGAAIGIATAAAGILRRPAADEPPAAEPTTIAAREPLPPDAVARVNERLIGRKDFEQALALDLAAGAVRNASTERRVLDRMIDEELRVQRAIQLRLHLTDPRVRMDLASAVAEAATVAAEVLPPDEAALRAHFEQKRDYFAGRGPLRVRQIWVAIVGGNLGEAFTRARSATTLLREKQSFEIVKDIAGNSEPRPVPDRLLSPEELGGLIGGTALNVALTLRIGEVTDPIRMTDGFLVLSRVRLQRLPHALESNAAELRKTATLQLADSRP